MPNNITNILVVSGDKDKRQAMFEALKIDECGLGSIDFEKVIPMPEYIFRGSLGQAEREKYGSANWYDWSIANWGTKWNNYGYQEGKQTDFDGSTLSFLTAWSHPHAVMAALVEQYPDLVFEVKWADEDFGYNVGHRKYEDGEEIFSNRPEGGSKEALELAAEIHGVKLDELGYTLNKSTNEYEYNDPEEAPAMCLQ